jgi:polysaccharide pyruvyl transferase CsaB
MKILMALMGLDIGGAETHVVELSRELTRQGHQIIIASNGGAYVPALEQDGILHVEVPMHQRSGADMAKSLGLLEQLIRREQPDLVHAHARIPAFLCGILQKKLHFPFITSAHGVFQVTPLLRLMTNWGDRTVAVSPDIRTYLMENYRVPADRIHVTINGISTDVFAPRPANSALKQALSLGDGPVIGLVGRLDEPSVHVAKEVIGLVPELVRACPDVEILIVGGGTGASDVSALAQAQNRQWGREVVHLTGPRTDVADLLSLVTVFVGVSRAALEAMSMAKPLILAGNPAYDQGYLGILTPEKLSAAQASNFCCRGCPEVTPEALLRDLLDLLGRSPARREELGHFGRQVILAQYSVRRMAQDYLDAYDRLLHPVPPIKAVISGYYGYHNLGDDAILWAIHRQLQSLSQPVELTVLSRRPRETAQKYGLRAVHRFSPAAVFRALSRCDLLIFGGGSLLQDRTSTRSLGYYLWVIRLARLLKKPVFLYANGIGPLDRASSRRRVKKNLSRCQAITLRDPDSLRELETLGISTPTPQLTGDPAFSLPPVDRSQARQELNALGIPEDAPMIGISVRQAQGLNTKEFAKLGDRIYGELHREVVFVVMQDPGDRVVSQEIQAQMSAPSHLVETPNRPETMLGIIGCMDAMVSLRLHTLIFAARQRVPVVGCVYDPKVAAFLKALDMPSCGAPAQMTADTAFAALTELLSRPKQPMDHTVSHLEAQSQKTVAALGEMLKL